jgi:hypothetical protein
MQNYAYARGSAPLRGPRRDGPAEEGFVSHSLFLVHPLPEVPQLPPLPSHGERTHSTAQASSSTSNTSIPQTPDRGRPTFGVDLAEQMTRDNVELPPIMEKCCQAIEKYGIRSQGIYRINGTSRKVAQLKEKLDKGSTPLFVRISANHYVYNTFRLRLG